MFAWAAEAGLPQYRLEAYASGEDHRDPAPVLLAAPPEPRQDRVGRLPALRGNAVVLPLEEPVDENREFVEREHHRQVVLTECLEYLVALLPPVARVDSRAELHLQFRDGQRVDPIERAAENVAEPGPDPLPCTPNGLRPGGNFGNRILRGIGGFQVDEDRCKLVSVLQEAQQLPDQARLAHPPLRRKQRMRSVPDTLPERLEFDFTVVEPVSLDPVRSGLPELHPLDSPPVSNRIIGNKTVG